MTTGPGQTAAELASACAELATTLADGIVIDVVTLEDRDDLLVFLETDRGRHALHVAPGGRRARVTTTRRRFPRRRFATGPRPDRLRELLVDARFTGAHAAPGERLCTLEFAAHGSAAEALVLAVELFGPRGLWTVLDSDRRILVLSRLPSQKHRELRPGSVYAPPPPATHTSPATPDEASEQRFQPPILEALDAFFTAADEREERHARRDGLLRALDKAIARAESREHGARAQLEAAGRADEIRTQADLLLAYGHGLPSGATELHAPDPLDPQREVVIPLDPRLKPHAQAARLYDKARKHQDGAEVAAQRAHAAAEDRAALEGWRARLLAEDAEADDVATVEAELARRGLVDAPRRQPKAQPDEQKLRKLTGGENFRRFESREGLMILVGRDGKQNDRLVTRVARGNDLWFHVGRGYAGSHVLVRVPKNRNASLETLLDAGTLAIHFSKVRGAELEEVVYCPAKNVRKPKGLPPGTVVPSRTKSLRVRREPERLKRLLDGNDDERR